MKERIEALVFLDGQVRQLMIQMLEECVNGDVLASMAQVLRSLEVEIKEAQAIYGRQVDLAEGRESDRNE